MKERIRKIIGDHAGLGVPMNSLENSTDLYSAGMTSHSSVVLMLALENEFDFEFPPELLNRGVFASINSIAAAIEGLVPAASHSTT